MNITRAGPASTIAQSIPYFVLFSEQARADKQHLGLLFTDLKSAFYSTLQEVALGALLNTAERQALLTALGLTPEEIATFVEAHIGSGSLLTQAGVAAPWVRAI